jgi:phage repressor protein C with HTH and peptisase S24 domain
MPARHVPYTDTRPPHRVRADAVSLATPGGAPDREDGEAGRVIRKGPGQPGFPPAPGTSRERAGNEPGTDVGNTLLQEGPQDMDAQALGYRLKGLTVEDILDRMKFAAGVRSQAELAEKLGVRRAAVTDAKNRGAIPARWFMDLCRKYQINPVWLETGFGPMCITADASQEQAGALLPARGRSGAQSPAGEEFSFVPKVKAVVVGGGGSLETEDNVESYYAFRRSWLERKGRADHMRLMHVAGESMEPTLRDSDVVLVDESQRDVVFGKIYVVGIDDGIVVKRLEKTPGKLMLISDNRDLYPPLEVPLDEGADVRVVGRVVWMARELQ